MEKYTGFCTTDNKPVVTNEFIADLREKEKEKILSNNFVAQTGPQEADLHASVDILITGGNRGGGKANTYDTPVITPNGYKLMGNLKVGDEICTPYEGVQKVTAIYEQGLQTIYTFHFDDGTTVQCMDSHRFWARTSPYDKFSEMTARDIMKKYSIGKKPPYSLRDGGIEYAEIPLCGEVQKHENVSPVDLPIYPFILGAMSITGYWEFPKTGTEMKIDRTLLRFLKKNGYKVFRMYGNTYVKGIPDEARLQITKKRVREPARIPPMYMNASVKARWSYLQGLWLFGGRSVKKHPYIALPNKPFIEDIAQMGRSLGMWVKVSEVVDDPEKIGWWQAVLVAPNDADIWYRTIRKKMAHENAAKPTSPHTLGVLTKKILYITKTNKEKKQCRCITVSGNHHLYLTDAYTVNHNTFTLLMEPLYDVDNKHFNGIIFRKEKDDLSNIIRDSRLLYSPFGHFNKSKDDLTWYFNSDAELQLTYYADAYEDFKDRFQGRQYCYIGIDEITQMEFEKFKYLTTCNRNSAHLKNRIIGTCNPDPTSWVRKFINWWIGSDGIPIRERDGVIRYCYMKGEGLDTIVWGDTPEEVYEQCKEEIDRLWEPEYETLGYTRERAFVKSVTFIRAELKYNKKLLNSDPSYLGGLAQQGEEQQARDLMGNWNFMSLGDDMVKMVHLMQCFQNDQMLDDKVHRASCDVAFTGGDNCVLWHRIGNHIADVYVCRLNSVDTCNAVAAKLHEWGVQEENLVYDLNGLGQTFKGFFRRARPFNNVEAVDKKFKNIYGNKKDQCMYLFAQRVINAEISFAPNLLDRKFKVGKKGQMMYLRDILLLERKCVRQDATRADKGYCNINKATMKSIIGWSPDFWESLMMSEDFFINKKKVTIPSWASYF